MGVQSDAINTLAEVHNRQVKKGLKTYGKPVVPFNGRSAYNDAMEEIVDTAVYVTQLEQERTILKLALESLYGACRRFLDSRLSSVVNSHVRMEFVKEVRSVREDLGAVGFILNDDAGERYYADSIAAFHAHIKAMLDDEDEYGGAMSILEKYHSLVNKKHESGLSDNEELQCEALGILVDKGYGDRKYTGTMPESAFVHVDIADAVGVVDELADHPLWDEGWEAGVQGKWQYDNPYLVKENFPHMPDSLRIEFSEFWEDGRQIGFKRYREDVEQKVETAIYDAEDIGEGGCMGDTSPICPKCGDELEWDSGDSSVGWPGQWYCPLCDREGVVEDES